MAFWKVSRFLITKGNNISRSSKLPRNFCTNVYEPDYLTEMDPEIPIYDSLNIQIKGYDYPILESYQKLVHKLADTLDIEVDDSWATPCQKLKLQKFKPMSSVVDKEYLLSIYERNVQICDVPSTSYTILLRLIQESIPEGVSVEVREALESHQEIRYVPDNNLKSLKEQLVEMGGPSKAKKK